MEEEQEINSYSKEKNSHFKGKVIKERKRDYNENERKYHRHHFIDEDITFKVSPRKIVKGILIVLILLTVFYMGRWTAPDYMPTVAAIEEVEDESGPGFFSRISGWFTADTKKEVLETETIVVEDEETAPEKETKEETIEEVEEEIVEEDVVEEDENVITNYKKVSFAINKIEKEWKGTWGKITHLDYTIKNSEEGTVKPDYFVMVVEGYNEFEKKVPLPSSSTTIPSTSSATSSATVPNGFAYSELTAGDLNSVQISISLYDSNGQLIYALTKEYNLSG